MAPNAQKAADVVKVGQRICMGRFMQQMRRFRQSVDGMRPEKSPQNAFSTSSCKIG